MHQIINTHLENYVSDKLFTACLCDPPYNIGMMGKQWDKYSDFQATAKEWGLAIKRLLHPGALIFMFGSPRCWHRLACGMEDAGLEMWDTLAWLHGQGFPKGQDIGKLIDRRNGAEREVIGFKDNKGRAANEVLGKFNENPTGDPISAPGSPEAALWEGYKTPALKPAMEPILCFRVPSKTKYADLALNSGVGALNIPGCRIGTEVVGWNGHPGGGAMFKLLDNEEEGGRPVEGRYPPNVILDEESAEMLDAQSGVSKSQTGTPHGFGGKGIYSGDFGNVSYAPKGGYKDIGGASRFMYCAKASPSERSAGLPSRNSHIAVKPLSLCRWLATLLLPPETGHERRLLVPFSGSGSEMIGAVQAGWDEVVGIEAEAEYVRIAEQRLAHWTAKAVAA